MNSIQSTYTTCPEYYSNMALFLKEKAAEFAECPVFFAKNSHGIYTGTQWSTFYSNILSIIQSLDAIGFPKGGKCVLFSKNSYEMLCFELALCCSGRIAVPIFSNFKKETAELLIRHSEAKAIFIEGYFQYEQIKHLEDLTHIWSKEQVTSDDQRVLPFEALLIPKGSETGLNFQAKEDEVCMYMYTSGTMGTPKAVQLMHRNILSQQAALSTIWKLKKGDRFLSYLPWHHSFGGIFELFSALYNGCTYYLESSYGKQPKEILENWKLVQPSVFFSVPKVYQSLMDICAEDPELEKQFFTAPLQFIFTAAASLPQRISDLFQQRGIPIMEGWGLTETSPCCTLTRLHAERKPGYVGFPIPGVQIRIAEDGEIQVKGPHIMKGYFHNEEANKGIFSEDGWFNTGDIGEWDEEKGLKLVSRKDRIFKLSNGEKVIPADLERLIETKCHYIQYVLVCGSGKEFPVALLFPNKKRIEQPDYSLSPEEGCFCPRSLDELQRCLKGCLHLANQEIRQKFSKIKAAALLNAELSVDAQTLTPSLKMAPRSVLEKYKEELAFLYGKEVPENEEIYIIELESNFLKNQHLV